MYKVFLLLLLAVTVTALEIQCNEPAPVVNNYHGQYSFLPFRWFTSFGLTAGSSATESPHSDELLKKMDQIIEGNIRLTKVNEQLHADFGVFVLESAKNMSEMNAATAKMNAAVAEANEHARVLAARLTETLSFHWHVFAVPQAIAAIVFTVLFVSRDNKCLYASCLLGNIFVPALAYYFCSSLSNWIIESSWVKGFVIWVAGAESIAGMSNNVVAMTTAIALLITALAWVGLFATRELLRNTTNELIKESDKKQEVRAAKVEAKVDTLTDQFGKFLSSFTAVSGGQSAVAPSTPKVIDDAVRYACPATLDK